MKRLWPAKLAMLGPGMLVAATGVGAGDLATGAFCGSKLGVAVLWAVVLGAVLKWALNEGLARWQLGTDTTLLEGAVMHLGPWVQWVFLPYLVLWSFFVGGALMSACGVTAHAIHPLFSPRTDKMLYGLLHSAAAVVLLRWGGYRWLKRIMGACIAVMFVTVVGTAVALRPAWGDIALGVFWPRIPDLHEGGLAWTVALMGGVGGTLTVLCYGYWIREEGRRGRGDVAACRVDLAAGYTMTALFGICMVLIGSTIESEGGGAKLIVQIADRLHVVLGPIGRWAFLIGAWGAVFSSLLGVWQSVPYLFADLCGLLGRDRRNSVRPKVTTQSTAYRAYHYALATLPAVGLWFSFEQAQKLYAIVGALFIPMLALVLLILCGRARLLPPGFRNRRGMTLLLVAALALFATAALLEIYGKLRR